MRSPLSTSRHEIDESQRRQEEDVALQHPPLAAFGKPSFSDMEDYHSRLPQLYSPYA
jgi:hypothetical protein